MNPVQFVEVDTEYLNYLRDHGDSRIPYKDYGVNRYKPFFKLFSVGDITYVANISSPKSKHYHYNDSLDFTKLQNKKGDLIGVVHTNLMFPVLNKHIKELSENDIAQILGGVENDHHGYVTKSLKRMSDYAYIIDATDVKDKAMINYSKAINGYLPSNRKGRTLDFEEMEETLIKYETEKAFPNKDFEITKIQHLHYLKIEGQSYCLTPDGLNEIENLSELHETITKSYELNDYKVSIDYEK